MHQLMDQDTPPTPAINKELNYNIFFRARFWLRYNTLTFTTRADVLHLTPSTDFNTELNTIHNNITLLCYATNKHNHPCFLIKLFKLSLNSFNLIKTETEFLFKSEYL